MQSAATTIGEISQPVTGLIAPGIAAAVAGSVAVVVAGAGVEARIDDSAICTSPFCQKALQIRITAGVTAWPDFLRTVVGRECIRSPSGPTDSPETIAEKSALAPSHGA